MTAYPRTLLVVSADSLRLPEQSRRWAVVRGADPSACDGPVVCRRRQHEVPDDAVWLVVPTSTYREPVEAWGELSECHDQQTQVSVDAVRQDCDDVNNEEYVTRWINSYRWATLAMWTFLGPGVFAVALGFSHLSRWIDGSEAPIAGTAVFWSWYLLTYILVALAALARLGHEAIRAWRWRRREHQQFRTWKGGTDECLIAGDLLRRGPNLRVRQWETYCAGVVPEEQ